MSLDDVVIAAPSGLRAGVQTLAASRQTDVLYEHAVVEPAHPGHVIVDSKDHADGCLEELEIAGVELPRLFVLAFTNACQAVEVPAHLAPPCEVGIAPLREIVQTTVFVLARLVPECVQDGLAQTPLGFTSEHMHLPRLSVGTARSAFGNFQNVL